MRSKRCLAVALLASLLCSALASAADARDPAAMLAEAERIHATDKAKAWQLLEDAEHALSATSDPLLRARAQLLECWLASAPRAAIRAVELGLPLAQQARSGVLQAKLVACRADALERDGQSLEAESEYAAAVRLGAQARDGAVEADARIGLAALQYLRGAMADALTNFQTAYRIHARLGNDKGRLDALNGMANVYADA